MSEQEYRLKWRRDSNKPTPESEAEEDIHRKEAVENVLEELGIEDEVEIAPTERILGGDLPYFTVANLTLLSIDVAINLKMYIENQGDEVTMSDELKNSIDEHLENREVNK